MLLGSLFGYSQNGGQFNENNVLKLEYVGYSSNAHIYKVTNKVNCQLGIKIDQPGGTSSQTMVGLQQTLVSITAPQTPQVNLKAKREFGASCKQNPDNGWVELQSSIVLPIKFGKILATRVSSKTIKLQFESEEDLSISHYDVKISYDAKNFKKVVVLFPNGVIGHKLYTAYINL